MAILYGQILQLLWAHSVRTMRSSAPSCVLINCCYLFIAFWSCSCWVRWFILGHKHALFMRFQLSSNNVSWSKQCMSLASIDKELYWCTHYRRTHYKQIVHSSCIDSVSPSVNISHDTKKHSQYFLLHEFMTYFMEETSIHTKLNTHMQWEDHTKKSGISLPKTL